MSDATAGAPATSPPITAERSLVICSTPRSGSWLLADAVEDLGRLGHPEEYLRPELERDYEQTWSVAAGDVRDFVRGMLAAGTTDNGVFSLKVHWQDCARLIARLRAAGAAGTDREVLESVIPSPRYIHMTRGDTRAQAISWCRALDSDEWWVVGGEGRSGAATAWDPDVEKLDVLEGILLSHDAAWRDFFERSGIDVLTVVYEDFVGDHEATVRRIAAHACLDLPADHEVSRPTMKRQADGLNARWRAKVEWAAGAGSTASVRAPTGATTIDAALAPHHRALPGGGMRREAPGCAGGDVDPAAELTVTVHLRARGDSRGLGWVNRQAGLVPAQRTSVVAEAHVRGQGASPQDVEAVRSFARSWGLRVDAVYPLQRRMVVAGRAVDVAGAFGVGLAGHAPAPGMPAHWGRLGPIHIPGRLLRSVRAVTGLDGCPAVDAGAIEPVATPPGVVAVRPRGRGERDAVDAVAEALHGWSAADRVLLVPWGAPEGRWSVQAMWAVEQSFLQASALGTAVVCACGEEAAFPATAPHALAVGSTAVAAASAVFPAPAWQEEPLSGDEPEPVRGRRTPDVALGDGGALEVAGVIAAASRATGPAPGLLHAHVASVDSTLAGLRSRVEAALAAGVPPPSAAAAQDRQRRPPRSSG